MPMLLFYFPIIIWTAFAELAQEQMRVAKAPASKIARREHDEHRRHVN